MDRVDNTEFPSPREETEALRRRILELEDFVGRVEANAADTIAITEELALAKNQAEFSSRRAEDSETRTRAVLDAVADGIVTIDFAGTIESANPAALMLLGYGIEDLAGMNISSLVSGPGGQSGADDVPPFVIPIARAALGNTMECVVSGQQGRQFPAELTLSEMIISGETLLTCVVRDITERKKADEAIRKLALNDPLTGLANRNEFQRRLNAATKMAERQNTSVALILIDLDKFKEVNDSFGHPVGDALLKFVGETLTETMRETDTVARIGGDEFAIVMTNLKDTAHVGRLAERLVDRLSKPTILDGSLVQPGASIGVSIYPRDATDVDELTRLCDKALYEAKNRGRGNYQFYDKKMDAKVRSERILENEMRLALVRNEFELHYQPQLDIASQQITGAEALVRWRHPVRGLLMPGEFIGQAEKNGLIREMGNQIFRAACEETRMWQTRGVRPFRIAVNFSPSQFKEANLVPSIESILDETGADPGWLEIEITENAMMDDTDETIYKLNQLKEMGFSIAIDDFGTGYCSLAYLTRFPIHKLKIDKTFIDTLIVSRADRAVTEAILNFSHCLDLKTIAEGVETASQEDVLRDLKCAAIQGYHFSRPLPPDQFRSLLEGGSPLNIPGTSS